MQKYEYYLRDQKLGFDGGVEVLRNHYPRRVFIGWPPVTYSSEENDDLISDLREHGIETAQMEILLKDYNSYVNQINYRQRYPNYYPGNFYEKTFEHFLALKLLNPQKNEKFMDVGAENSPHAAIFSKLTGCDGYVQDIMLKPGIHGKNIGCDASTIPVANNFFDSILVACAIEHFENESDIKFMKEAARIMASGGRIIILPLYLHSHPFYVTDPTASVPGQVNFSGDMDIHCVQDWGNRHGRFYSPQTLYDRLVKENADNFDFTVIHIKNFNEIHASIYCRFILFGRKK